MSRRRPCTPWDAQDEAPVGVDPHAMVEAVNRMGRELDARLEGCRAARKAGQRWFLQASVQEVVAVLALDPEDGPLAPLLPFNTNGFSDDYWAAWHVAVDEMWAAARRLIWTDEEDFIA